MCVGLATLCTARNYRLTQLLLFRQISKRDQENNSNSSLSPNDISEHIFLLINKGQLL